MSQPDLARRFSGLHAAMEARDIAAAVYSHCPDFTYLTALPPLWREEGRDLLPPGEALLVPRTGRPILFSDRQDIRTASAGDLEKLADHEPADRLVDRLETAMQNNKGALAVGRECRGDLFLKLAAVAGSKRLTSGWRLNAATRKIKDTFEIESLRKAAVLTDEAVRRAAEGLREGITMRELQLDIERHGRDLGASGVSFPPMGGFYRDTGQPGGGVINYAPEEGLQDGTTVFFDVGFVLNGYCSDWGRSLFFGQPARRLSDAYTALQESASAAISRIETGITQACEVYGLVEAELEKRGFADEMRARLEPEQLMGHQIGTEVHEDPWLKPDNDEVLQPGMVMCIEPKLWHDGRYYMRVEDMVLITDSGAEILTQFDRKRF